MLTLPDDRAPIDHYGEALASLAAQGGRDCEVVAALIAAVAESIEDDLRKPRWITVEVTVTPFLFDEEPPKC